MYYQSTIQILGYFIAQLFVDEYGFKPMSYRCRYFALIADELMSPDERALPSVDWYAQHIFGLIS